MKGADVAPAGVRVRVRRAAVAVEGEPVASAKHAEVVVEGMVLLHDDHDVVDQRQRVGALRQAGVGQGSGAAPLGAGEQAGGGCGARARDSGLEGIDPDGRCSDPERPLEDLTSRPAAICAHRFQLNMGSESVKRTRREPLRLMQRTSPGSSGGSGDGGKRAGVLSLSRGSATWPGRGTTSVACPRWRSPQRPDERNRALTRGLWWKSPCDTLRTCPCARCDR